VPLLAERNCFIEAAVYEEAVVQPFSNHEVTPASLMETLYSCSKMYHGMLTISCQSHNVCVWPRPSQKLPEKQALRRSALESERFLQPSELGAAELDAVVWHPLHSKATLACEVSHHRRGLLGQLTAHLIDLG